MAQRSLAGHRPYTDWATRRNRYAVWEGLGGAPSLPGRGVTRLEMIDLAFRSVKSLVKQGFFVIQTSK